LRLARSHPRKPARGGARPRRNRWSDGLARHAADVQARDPHRHRLLHLADGRRLLPQRSAGHGEDVDVREPDRHAERAHRRQNEDGVARADPIRHRAAPDDVLPSRDQGPIGAWRVSTTLDLGSERTRARGYFKNPWRKPRVLQGITIAYLLWSILPVVIAVIFSFNDSRSRIVWQGFSMRWWTADPTDSILHDPQMRAALAQTYRLAILVVLISVPIGTLFAIGIDRWHGRPARGAHFVMFAAC